MIETLPNGETVTRCDYPGCDHSSVYNGVPNSWGVMFKDDDRGQMRDFCPMHHNMLYSKSAVTRWWYSLPTPVGAVLVLLAIFAVLWVVHSVFYSNASNCVRWVTELPNTADPNGSRECVEYR